MVTKGEGYKKIFKLGRDAKKGGGDKKEERKFLKKQKLLRENI